jgi:uncharacterized protein (DUF58 family)
LISGQGDAVGLLAEGGGTRMYLSPRAGRQHLRAVLAALGALTAAGSWEPADALRRATDRLRRRGLLIVLSDFYDDENRAFGELRRAARVGHDVVVLQIVSRAELELPYRGDIELTDAESGRKLPVNAPLARAAYKDAVARFLETCRARAASHGFQYALIVTDMPPEQALRNLLLRRRASA